MISAGGQHWHLKSSYGSLQSNHDTERRHKGVQVQRDLFEFTLASPDADHQRVDAEPASNGSTASGVERLRNRKRA
jgi:hypothetical protein